MLLQSLGGGILPNLILAQAPDSVGINCASASRVVGQFAIYRLTDLIRRELRRFTDKDLPDNTELE